MSFSKRLVSSSFLFALLYILFVVYAMNIILINDVITGAYPLFFKLKLFAELILGIQTTMMPINLFMLIINALLTGIVISLILQKIVLLKKMGRVHFVAGGSSFIGLVSGGCVSCGLPLLSLFGLSGTLLFLPFKGSELPYISFIILSLSLFFLIKNKKNEIDCQLPKKAKK